MASVVPEGHVPFYVGDDKEKFVVPLEVIERRVFVELLKRAAQEYGYEQKGVLQIPCTVRVFERVLSYLLDSNETSEDEEEEDILRLLDAN